MKPRRRTRRGGALGLACLLLTGCTSLNMPQVKPYEGFAQRLSPPQDVQRLPPHTGKEVWLGYDITPDGRQENRLGSGERCVFVFVMDLQTRRLVSWRFAAKDDPADCQPRP